MQESDRLVIVGVKYCGGCNERFDRMGTFRNIVSQCSKSQFIPTLGKENYEFDYIVVVNGCQAQCADISKLKSKNGFFSMYQDADFEKCIETIHKLEEMKDK